MIISFITFFIFNYCTFGYISKLIIDFRKDKMHYLKLSAINTLIMLTLYFFKAPYYISYIVALITLTIEFSELKKHYLPQSFLYSGILVINISSAHIFIIALYCQFINIKPYELFFSPNLYFFSLLLLFIALFIIFYICSKIISPEDIKKISSNIKYCTIISSVIMFILLCTFVDILILNSQDFRIELSFALMFSAIMTLLIFYILFFYTVKNSNLDNLKQKAEELEVLRVKNIINKKNMQDKILKANLTGCYNRKYIVSKIKSKFDNNIFNFGIFFIDINKLKFVNDTLGHDFGDEYILNVSKAIKNAVRENDLIAKIGGDEFLILLNNVTETYLKEVEDKIRKNLEEIDRKTPNYTVSASMGYVFVDEQTIKLGMDEVIKLADEKMRYNKKCFKGENA